jgi:hypothetical protein
MCTKLSISLVLLLLCQQFAIADIELVSSTEEGHPPTSTVKVKVKTGEDLQTEITLRYPGTCATLSENGDTKVMLRSPNGLIAAFNFQPATQVNESVALVLLPNGKLVQFFNLNQMVLRAVSVFKGRLDEAGFRVVKVSDSAIDLDYTDFTPVGKLFRVKARINSDGEIQIGSNDVHDLPAH